MVLSKDERLQALAQTVEAQGVLRLRDAARLLGVSEMTVRRDIAGASALFSYLGGHIVPAVPAPRGDVYRMASESGVHVVAKRAACRQAARLIAADSTVFIDCGTTLEFLTECLPDSGQTTVICYSLNIANRLAHRPHVRLILLGGHYHAESDSFSADGGRALVQFGINTAFLSAGGLDWSRGVSCSHLHEVPIKQQAMASAHRSCLVIDSSKIGLLRPVIFARPSEFDSIIDETGPLAGPLSAPLAGA